MISLLGMQKNNYLTVLKQGGWFGELFPINEWIVYINCPDRKNRSNAAALSADSQ